MRCRTCDYPLWNIRPRECPECGSPFRPSEYEFTLNSVRFCCPSCNQAYYGTGQKGHLVPPQFDCVSCGRPMSMDDAVLLPTEGVAEEITVSEPMPWLERHRLGFFKSMFQTIGKSMVSPDRLINATPENSPIGRALSFAVVTNTLYFIFSGVPFFGFLFGFGGGGSGVGMVGAAIGGFAGMLLGWAVSLVVICYVWTALVHLILRMSGDTPHPFNRTLTAIFYSSGANGLLAIPCMGQYISPLWWLVSACIMVKSAQKATGLRASLAVCIPPVLAFAITIGGYIAFMLTVVSTAPWNATAPISQPKAVASSMSSSLISYSQDNNGQLPDHALRLLDNITLSSSDFSTYTDPTYFPGNIPSSSPSSFQTFGKFTIEEFEVAPTATQSLYIDSWLASNANVIAHRIGDFVFVYHGINVEQADTGLWLYIMQPHSDKYAPVNAVNTYYVGLADGSVSSFPKASLSSELAAQNTLRKSAGLPPLPETLLDATESDPIVAPATPDTP